ncbi:MAG: single-stranded DNA-binding protein, partial [Saprospiraceae bacterium]
MINQLTLIGRLGADPEIKHVADGLPVAKLSVATSDSYKDKSGQWQETTEWHTVVCWRELADRVGKYKKGQLVCVIGKVTYRKYEKDGQTRYVTEVIANTVRLCEKSDKSDAPAQTQSQ